MGERDCATCGGRGCFDWAFLAVDGCGVCGGSGVSPFKVNLGGKCRLLIIGHGRHGKDTVSELLAAGYGLCGVSSSEFAAQKAVFPLVSDIYPDWRAAYEARGDHRELWFHAIAAYNLRPGPMLAQQILEHHDIYTGMRRRAEFERSRGFFDCVIWVDASKRLPLEPSGSMELSAKDADLIVDNNGPEAALPGAVADLVEAIRAFLGIS